MKQQRQRTSPSKQLNSTANLPPEPNLATINVRNDYSLGPESYSRTIQPLAQFGIVKGLDSMDRRLILTGLDSPICKAGTVVLAIWCWNPNPFTMQIGSESPGIIISSADAIPYKCRVWHS